MVTDVRADGATCCTLPVMNGRQTDGAICRWSIGDRHEPQAPPPHFLRHASILDSVERLSITAVLPMRSVRA